MQQAFKGSLNNSYCRDQPFESDPILLKWRDDKMLFESSYDSNYRAEFATTTSKGGHDHYKFDFEDGILMIEQVEGDESAAFLSIPCLAEKEFAQKCLEATESVKNHMQFLVQTGFYKNNQKLKQIGCPAYMIMLFQAGLQKTILAPEGSFKVKPKLKLGPLPRKPGTKNKLQEAAIKKSYT